MHKLLIHVLFILAVIATANCALDQSSTPQLYKGVYSGTIRGDANTNSTLVLNLNQHGQAVNGTATVGEGLKVDAGICRGLISIPSGMINVSGSVDPQNARHLQASSSIKESILLIQVAVLADLSKDASSMEIQMKLNMPWPCRSPTLFALLKRNI